MDSGCQPECFPDGIMRPDSYVLIISGERRTEKFQEELELSPMANPGLLWIPAFPQLLTSPRPAEVV